MEENLQSLLEVSVNDNEEVVVSSRALHKFLEIKTRYKVWILRMIEYGFEEHKDYERTIQKIETAGGEQNLVDYILKIDMAKEICMIQRTEKGKQARCYFIEIEKKFNSPQEVLNRLIQLKNSMSNSNITSKTVSPNLAKSAIVTSTTYTNIDTNFRDTAKILGIKESLFINWLLINNFCYRDLKDNIKPYSQYMEYFSLREFTTESGYSGIQTLINAKGRETFKTLLLDEEILKESNKTLLN